MIVTAAGFAFSESSLVDGGLLDSPGEKAYCSAYQRCHTG